MKFGDATVQDWKFKCWWSLNCVFSCGQETTELNFVGLVCWFRGCLLVEKEQRKCVNEEDPSPCALVAVLSQVKITAGRMELDAGQYNDLLFVMNRTWRLFSGECDCEKSSQRNVKVLGNKLTSDHVFLFQFITPCCFAYKWFPEPLVFQNMGVCPSVDV